MFTIKTLIQTLQEELIKGVDSNTEVEVIKGAFAYSIKEIKPVYSKLEERKVFAIVTT